MNFYFEIIKYLESFKNKQGLYIIRPKESKLLRDICGKLDYPYKSDIAYIGKAAKTKSSDLYIRSKQEMGWSNFKGATFVKKIGLYLDFDVINKSEKEIQEAAKFFICSNFQIECIEFSNEVNLLKKETEYIHMFSPCLNHKKNKSLSSK